MALTQLLDWWPDWWAIALAIILILGIVVPHLIFPDWSVWIDIVVLICLLPLIIIAPRMTEEKKEQIENA